MAVAFNKNISSNTSSKPYRPRHSPHFLPTSPHQSPQPSTLSFLSLPIPAIYRILSYLLVSPTPLLLKLDTSTPPTYRTHLTISILLVNRHLYSASLPILYGKNTFTTSSPATSYDFDAHILSIPGRMRVLVRKVVLEINWGKELWMKFPLVASRMGELKGLKELRIMIVEGDGVGITEKGQGERKGGILMKRQGRAAEAMLKAEKKVLREMVMGLKGLRVFELKGFEDDNFARELEEWVRNGRRG
ncbi:MAG: hypothetical protein Q9219_007321 [cf. Caloplaca sp. 3 TL-2023]